MTFKAEKIFYFENLKIYKYPEDFSIKYEINDSTQLLGEIRTRIYPLYKIRTFCKEEILKKTDLNPKDLILEIDEFLPYSSTKFKERKKGLGRFMLETIANESKSSNQKIIYGISNKKLMQRLLLNSNYQSCEKNENEFYLIL